MDQKKTLALIFGGQSSEHEVSCMSALTILSAIDTEKYDCLLIGITKEGQWVKAESAEDISSGAFRQSNTKVVLSPAATEQCVYLIERVLTTKIRIDLIFPVLHGMYGEDGTIQGIFEMAKIPYVGCGVLASAAAMDKAYTKIIVNELNIRQASHVVITHLDMKDMDASIQKVTDKLPFPVFVKPSKAGSSQGVNKAGDRKELKLALLEAIKHDRKIIVEETIIGREIECAILGGYDPHASNVGEILAADAFYTYDAKYNNAQSKTDVHPILPEGVLDTVRDYALRIFQSIDGYGLSRVDFFLEKDTNEIVFNEINTFPGFTSISMYPMLWADQGIDLKNLVNQLIQLAYERFNL